MKSAVAKHATECEKANILLNFNNLNDNLYNNFNNNLNDNLNNNLNNNLNDNKVRLRNQNSD